MTAIDGSRVIVARGISARITPIRFIEGAPLGKGDLAIRVDTITVEAVEANLDSEPDRSLKVAHAFDPRTQSPSPTPVARGLDIDLPEVAVAHVWMHGLIAEVPPIDADADALEAAVLSTPALTKLDVPHLTLVARGLPMGMTPRGRLTAHLALPFATGARISVGGTFDGAIGEIPLTANLTMEGDMVDGMLDVPEVSAAKVQASVEDAPV